MAASSQNLAFNSLLFFFRHLLGKEFGKVDGVVRAKKRPYIPVMLSREDVHRILLNLSYPYDLVVGLLYGCGLRLFDCLNLRVNNFRIFQDIMIFFSRRWGKQGRKEKLTKGTTGTYPFLWYAILIFTTTLLLSGSLFLVNIFDPFSIFGRFSTQLFLPMGATLNNVLVSITESFGQYVFAPVNLRPLLWSVFWISYGWFVLVIFMSFYHGRLYCNTLCPVGAFFSLLSRHSLFKFAIDRQKCTTCGKCQRMCRSHCMDPAMGKIDGARCVSCFDCMDVCPENAIEYTMRPLSLKEKQRTRIGSVRFERDKCLVYTQKRDCGTCAEVCPTHAVHTILENNIHHPRLMTDACIGCGACQLVCPVTPKAIYVVAVNIHEKAGLPFFQQDTPAAPTGVMGSDASFPF